MLCQVCKKNPAAVHITKILNNEKSEFHLCEKCAGEREELNIFSPLSINDLLTGFLIPLKEAAANMQPSLKCEECGMDYKKFKKAGRFGCQNCYQVFKEEISPLIKRIQGGAVRHTGKIPHTHESRLCANRKIEDLKKQLQRAVETEAFEEAVKLRDEIRSLERKQEQEG